MSMMLKFKNEISRKIIYDNYLTLIDLLSSDRIFEEDNDYIKNTIEKIRNTKPFLPEEVFNSFNRFIAEYFDPIVLGSDAFEKFRTSDIGQINSDGIFEFHDESCVTLFFARIADYYLHLEETLIEMAMTELRPYFE